MQEAICLPKCGYFLVQMELWKGKVAKQKHLYENNKVFIIRVTMFNDSVDPSDPT